jgi:WD40 repeat protein
VQVALERVIGTTSCSNATFAINHISGDIATASGCVVVLYSVAKNKQVRFFRTKQAISALVFSPDGQYLAAGQKGRKPTICIWSTVTGIQRAELSNFAYGVACLAFSPDNQVIVGVGFKNDRCLHIWDWQDPSGIGRKLASGKLSQKVMALSFVENGDCFVTAGEKHLKFWNMETIHSVLSDSSAAVPLTISSRPAIMSEGGTEFEVFVDVACGTGVGAGNVYALSSAGMLCAFDVTERLMEQWVNLKVKAAFSVDLVADAAFVGCSDGIVRCFSLPNLVFKGLLPLPPALGCVNLTIGQGIPAPRPDDVYPAAVAVRTTSGGRHAAVLYGDRSIFVWDVADLDDIRKIRSMLAHAGPIWDVTAAITDTAIAGGEPPLPEGTFITSSSDCTVRYWNLNPRASARQVGTAEEEPASCNLGSGSGIASALTKSNTQPLRGARRRNAYMKELLQVSYITAENPAIDGGVTPRYASGSGLDAEQHYGAATWPSRSIISTTVDTETGIASATMLDIGARCIALQAGNKHLAVGDRQGNLRVFDVKSNKCIYYEVAHDSEILSVSYSPCSGDLLVTGSRDRLVHVFNATSTSAPYSVLTTIADHASSVNAVCFTRNESQLVTASSDANVIFHKITKPETENAAIGLQKGRQFAAPQGSIYDIDTDATSKSLVTAGQDKTVQVWAIRTGKIVRTFKPDSDVNRLTLDPSGLFMATASVDKSLCIYDYFSGRCLARTTGHSELITGLCFTPDCRRLISVSGDGCIFVWRLSSSITKAILDRMTEIEKAKTGIDGASLVSPTELLHRATASCAGNHSNNSTVDIGHMTSVSLPDVSSTIEEASTIIDARMQPAGAKPPAIPRAISPVRERPLPQASPAPLESKSPAKLPTQASRIDLPLVMDSVQNIDLSVDTSHVAGSAPAVGRGYRGDASTLPVPQLTDVASPVVRHQHSALDAISPGGMEFRQSVLPAWAKSQASTSVAVTPSAPVGATPTGGVRPASKWAAFMTASTTFDLMPAAAQPPLPPQARVLQVQSIAEEAEVEHPELDVDEDEVDDEPASELPQAAFPKPLEDIPVNRESFSVSFADKSKKDQVEAQSIDPAEHILPDMDNGVPEVADDCVAMSALHPPAASATTGDQMRQSVTLQFLRRAAGEPPPLVTPTEPLVAVPPSVPHNFGSRLGASVAAKLRRGHLATPSRERTAALAPVTPAVKFPDMDAVTTSKLTMPEKPDDMASLLTETAQLHVLLENARHAAEAEAVMAVSLAKVSGSAAINPQPEDNRVHNLIAALQTSLANVLDEFRLAKAAAPGSEAVSDMSAALLRARDEIVAEMPV